MKNTALALLILLTVPAHAQIIPALPFQLQNNTTADATQVMADFNQILNSVNLNAAKNGSNSDITALLGLTTPLAPSVGGTTTYTGGTSGGSANAQTLTPVVPTTFTLTAGSRVGFIVGIANTAQTTLNVAATGAKNVLRHTQFGAQPASGGELVVGEWVEVIYDGTSYQIQGRADIVGTIADYIGTGAPLGWAVADGSCISQTGAGAVLFAGVAGTGWGSCSAGLFALPDVRGRMTAGVDGGAGRITSAGSSCAGTLATGCGAQNHVQSTTELASHLHGLVITDPGHVHTYGNPLVINSNPIQAAVAASTVFAFSNTSDTQTDSAVTGISGVTSGVGSSVAAPILNPLIIVTKIIKL